MIEIPKNIEAEEAVLGALVIDAARILPKLKLEVTDFYLGAHQDIFAAITALYPGAADPITIANWLNTNHKQVDGSLLVKLVDACSTVAYAEHYAEIVLEKSKRRQIMNLGIMLQGKSIEDDTGLVIEEARRKLTALSQTGRSNDWITMNSAISEFFGELSANFPCGIQANNFIKTGLGAVDDLIGGLVPGAKIVVAGRPSMGKSTLAMNWTLHIARDRPVYVVTPEIPRMMFVSRAIAIEGLIPGNTIIRGPISEADLERIKVACDRLSSYPIIFSTTPKTVQEIKGDIDSIEQAVGKKLGALFIDRLELIRYREIKGEPRVQSLGRISQDLMETAIELNIPVVMLMQLSRKCEERNDKRPMLSDLRDCGEVEQNAKMVIFIYRDEYYDANSPDKGLAELIVAKNMFGATGTIMTKFQKEIPGFYSIERRVA